MTRIVPTLVTIDAPTPVSNGAPNLWAIVQALPWIGGLPLNGLAMATTMGATAWLAAYFSTRPPRGEALLSAALLIALVLPGLLPQMQPHDFLLAVALSVALAIRQREAAIAALIMGGWLSAIFLSAALGTVPIMVATLLIARPFLASPANDNGLPLNPVAAYPG
ncbi:MAG: hypothetical protein ABIR08_02855 [Sphingomonas sp.]